MKWREKGEKVSSNVPLSELCCGFCDTARGEAERVLIKTEAKWMAPRYKFIHTVSVIVYVIYVIK